MVAVVVILYLAHLARYTAAMSFVKRAAASDLVVTDRLLRQIHDENPSFWPHGLSRAHFDGGLYLLSKQAGMEPVGFVGWQERHEQGRRVGYYSIGILPDYRRKEYAKRAVQAVLTEKSAGVDEVRAMVASHNEPSKQLAHSLEGVTLLEKEAAGKLELAKMLGTALAGGTSTMLLQDNMMHPGEPLGLQALRPGENDKSRNLMNIVNFALGAGGASGARSGFKTMAAGKPALGSAKVGLGLGAMITGPIVKDLAMDGHRAIEGVDRLSKDLPGAVAAAKPDAFKIPDSLVNGGLALGAAGIGTAALISILKMKERRREAEAARGGRIRVTLPTKNPGDSETTIDMPTEGFDMSAALQGKLKRDTKRRLLLETRQRTIRRKPVDPNNLTQAELEDQQLELERQQLELEHGQVPKNFLKAASLSSHFRKQAGAAPAVPSPPAQGTNPALRMTAEAQAAQQAAQGASTDGNPQIMQAQQAASAAEQKAQQDVAAAQQATQQESMQRDQAHQQELSKKDQEVFQARQEIEIQKTEVEKAKVEMELAKAKMDAAKEIDDSKKSMTDSLSKGDNSAVFRMNKQRLARIKSRLSKVAAFTQTPTGTNTSTDVSDDSVYYRMGGFRQNPSFTPPTTPEGYMDANRAQQAQLGNDWGSVRPAYNHVSTPPAGPAQLRPDTAQRINDNGNEFQAYGGLVRPHLYRTSYGKLGDMAYGQLVRPMLMTPSRDDQADWSSLSPETMAASPDAFDSMLRAGQTLMNTPR